MEITKQNLQDYLSTKSDFYVAGWKAAEAAKNPKKVPDGDNPFYAEYEAGFSDQIQFNENEQAEKVRFGQMMADVA